MASRAEILVHGTADDVAEAFAARLMSRLVELQRDARTPQVALTGGRIATWPTSASGGGPQLRRRLESGRAVVGRRALRRRRRRRPQRPPGADGSRVVATRSGAGPPDAGRRRRPRSRCGRRGLRRRARRHRLRHLPARDGPGRPRRVALSRAPVLLRRRARHPGAVLPKPPPERISLTLEVINSAAEVWFCVTGADKAAAARLALSGAGPLQVPAAGAHGRERTLWLLDREAAADLPPTWVRAAFSSPLLRCGSVTDVGDRTAATARWRSPRPRFGTGAYDVKRRLGFHLEDTNHAMVSMASFSSRVSKRMVTSS